MIEIVYEVSGFMLVKITEKKKTVGKGKAEKRGK